jgi:aspartyl-tRNA(Asn)/glutamyl-tRNA(Gln) amidotransferase subunit A
MAGPDEIDKQSFLRKPKSYLNSINEKPNKLKIGWDFKLGYITALEPEVEKSVLAAIDKFESFGWSTENVELKLNEPYISFLALVFTGTAYDFKSYMEEWRDKLSPTLVQVIDAAENYSSFDIIDANVKRMEIYNIISKYFKEYDILITPTTAVPAFGSETPFPPKINNIDTSFIDWMGYTYPFNMTWNPAANIPCGWSRNGLPIGMQIIGRQADEETVLQVSKAFEEIAPWQDKRPKFN